MNLTAGEREKFEIYLTQVAADDEKLVAQLWQMPAGSVMAKRYEREAEACRIVAELLGKIETVEIKGEKKE